MAYENAELGLDLSYSAATFPLELLELIKPKLNCCCLTSNINFCWLLLLLNKAASSKLLMPPSSATAKPSKS